MADQKIRISELPSSSGTEGLQTLGVNAQNESVKVPLGDIIAEEDRKVAEANTASANAEEKATQAKTAADNAAQGVQQINNKVGVPNGIAPLNADRHVPTANLPSEVFDVVEFKGKVSGVTIQASSVTKSSTDQDCDVVYCTDTDTFILRLTTIAAVSTDGHKAFLFSYYNNWLDAAAWGSADINGRIPLTGKVYISTSDNTLHRFDGDTMQVVGSSLGLGHTADTAYPGDEGQENRDEIARVNTKAQGAQDTADQVQEDLQTLRDSCTEFEGEVETKFGARPFIDYMALMGLGAVGVTFETMRAVITANYPELRVPGVVVTWDNGQTQNRYTAMQFCGYNVDAQWDDETYWQKFGGGASVGNCYNVTNDVPKTGEGGFYTLAEAIAVAFNKGYTSVGMQITFAIARSSWKTYQYVGADSSETAYKNEQNWLDLAAMSAGAETLINVDALCGPCKSAPYYSLAYAISALTALSAQTGIQYAKSGLVITYCTGDKQWECKQFIGDLGDFGQEGLWHDFGGGGSELVANDNPEAGGTDAFSTGGAYEHLPVDSRVTQEEGKVSIELLNADGQQVMNPIEFLASQGGGGEASGTIITITPEHSPFYAKAGGEIVLRAAIRSVTMAGAQEQLNIIERVELYDRDSNTLLETIRLNKASSADTETYDFEFDLSSYFPLAAQRKFKMIAYDDSDHTGTRNINVTAVDVTIKSEQTLNYTPSTAIYKGGAAKVIPMYRFPNNASDKGILCTTEILIGGVWKTLGTKVVTDTFSNSISINPQDCCGGVLTHGAYSLRIHGEDVASGVVGNYLHTQIMVIEQGNTTPIVVSRFFTEEREGVVKALQSVSIDFAAYSPTITTLTAEVRERGVLKQTTEASRSATYTYTQRVKDVATDGSVTLDFVVSARGASSQHATFKVQGSLIDIESVTAQLMFDIDMAGRSNSDVDKSISDHGYTLSVAGANYTTNGFVRDSFGLDTYGTPNDKGVMALRIAENVTARLNYAPFNQAGIETNGLAVQFRIRTKHVADDTARLISCISNGFGFYVTGKQVVFTTDNSATVAHTISAALKDDSTTDVCIVIEPTSQAPYAGIGVAKMYFDGELIGACYYETGSLARHATQITFDGREGDLYLYNIRAWETYFSFEQDFNNYLLKMNDTDAMITEYGFNQVMASQAAEGKPATNRPQASALKAIGIPYFVLCKNPDTADTEDNYPPYIESLTGDKKTSRNFDVYAYFPDRPWQDFKATAVPTTNQGTTSSMRPIKNIKMKLGKCAGITLLHSRDEFTGADLAKYDACAASAAKKRVQVLDTTTPTNIITVKVDYSESGGANNGASCTMFNELQIALGDKYITPAQKVHQASGSPYVLNTSIDSIPCAFFRTDNNSPDATSPAYGYFHAKGNWNCDKGDAAIFGFEGVEGYNKGCLNYGDFVEVIAGRNQTLAALVSSVDKSGWLPEKVYVLSEFCGPAHKVFRYQNGTWTETTGTMTYSGGRWRITGDVVNPVENYELRAYDSLDWFQGVNSPDDMLTLVEGKPKWLAYFESRYPDDDDLNSAYEHGLKLPYQLYRWLKWCQDCNHHLTAADGNITLGGVSVQGTPQNRLAKFKRELQDIANPYSIICYALFTDYIAAVDQRSKNMMVGFYLDQDGVTRMYLNHLYDGDTILGSDNDCGLTIPAELDPNNDPQGYYQGHDSVLYQQLANSDVIWVNPYTSDADAKGNTISVAEIAAKMRTQKLTSGLVPFSPLGIEKYWITDRLSKWPKLVSSYDGVRKYITHSKSNDNYFFALHGLSIQRLQDFVQTRFRFRDGFYRCGDTYTSAIQMRCTGTNMSITIKAAKDGFFGIGVDNAQSARESVYLQAGESATLRSGNTNLGSGVMLYIYGADRIAELDVRGATPKQEGWDISKLVLLKKLIIGGAGYSPATNNGDELATLNLGALPFLEELDVRNFPLVNIDASKCPRLKSVLATGSQLQSFTPAETSPLATLTLPDTMTSLAFVNLPNLRYPNGGLTLGNCSKVTRLQLTGCANINTIVLMSKVITTDGAKIKQLSMQRVDVTADTSLLDALVSSGAMGIGSDLDHGCDGLTGTWLLTSLIEDTALSALRAYFPSLTLHNSQYTVVMFDDTMDDPQNITNLDNGTTGDDYVPSGHLLRIKEHFVPVRGKLNTATGRFECRRMSRTDYHKLADGTEFDYRDNAGTGDDAMKVMDQRCWYKGINDFKNQKKYIAWSSIADNEPISSARHITRSKLNTLSAQENVGLNTTAITEGTTLISDTSLIVGMANYNIYNLPVTGMKQVRWPGMNNSQVGAAFVNAQGVVIKKFNMAVSANLFDFVEGDYIFCDVPDGAVRFVFTSKDTNGEREAIAVDSSEVEAIEPDWVECGTDWAVAIYHGGIDSLRQLRSVSGQQARNGNGTATTSNEWTYDADGYPTNTPVGDMNYTLKDICNLGFRRGAGYQCIDYEMSKFVAILWFSLSGNRDSQLVLGYGRGANGTSGNFDTIGDTDTQRTSSNNGNKCLGLENFIGCDWEVMENVAVNIPTYKQFLKDHGVETGVYPLDGVWHIYDPISKTERVVQGKTDKSGCCIGRVKHGRFCDVIASALTSDSSVFAANYCDCQYYSHSRARVVGRSSYNAYASGGLVYASASYASASSSSYCGSRLAFRGTIQITD